MCTLTRYLGFMGVFLNCLVGCLSMIVWTPAVLGVLYACVLYFCICTCSAQLSMFHMERHSRNTLMIIIITSCQLSSTEQLSFRRFPRNRPQMCMKDKDTGRHQRSATLGGSTVCMAGPKPANGERVCKK